MSELEYRAAPNASAKLEVLNRMADVVLNTTAFIADFPEKHTSTGTHGTYYDLVWQMRLASNKLKSVSLCVARAAVV